MTTPGESPLHLLEPGALLGGALFRSLVADASAVARLPPGTRLGPFRIVDELGAGGMGVVYRAERDDGQFRQQVAIKCVARAHSLRESDLFRRERQILAEIRHPHIARMLDGGQQADGRLWFAMELVEGARIDAHARQQSLTVAARVALMRQAIAAVAFAHQRLLLHRDIKPGNVLVDADGGVKLLAFGIAALIADTDAARAYAPGWASPEQLAGGIVGPASDQYQLGLLLDALLHAGATATATGPEAATRGEAATETATAVDAPAATRRVAAEYWLAMPAARRVELQAIIARATASDAGQRYGSVAEFDSDLGRWLEHRPVFACGTGLAYALRCAVRRHPLVSAASLVGVLGVAVLIAAFSWRLAQERDLARASAARAEREAATAQAINQFLRDDLIRAADPYGVNAKDAPIGELIEKAIPRVEQRLAQQPVVAGELYAALGATLLNLGRPAPAAQAMDLAIERFTGVYGAGDERVLQQRLYRADVEEYAARYDSLRAQLDALKRDVAPLGPMHKLAFDVDRYLAWADYITGDFAKAAAGYEAARARAQAAGIVDPDALATLQAGLSLALTRLNRHQEALDAANEARRLRIASLGADHPETLAVGFQLATALVGLDRTDEAVRILADLYARFRERFGPAHSQTIIAAHELGVNLGRLERFDDAIAPLSAAVEAKRASFGPASGNTMNSMAQLALVQVRAGRTDAARATVAAIWAGGYVAQNDYDRRSESVLYRIMGEIALADGRPDAAQRACETSRDGVEKYFPEGHLARLQTQMCLALARWAIERSDGARRDLLALKPALLAAGRAGAFWQARVDAALGGSSP
ncbi:MAG: protein kinase domain-containing protein [Pseudomonadota bacterium]